MRGRCMSETWTTSARLKNCSCTSRYLQWASRSLALGGKQVLPVKEVLLILRVQKAGLETELFCVI